MKQRIHGIGTDIIELSRIERVLEQDKNHRFVHRVLTEKELELYRQKVRSKSAFVGGRFAAKEAVVKALGTGIGNMVGFLDIEILPDKFGKPQCLLSEQAKMRLKLHSSHQIHVSISHSQSYATAMAIVEILEE